MLLVRSCPSCGDRYEDTHNCYAQARHWQQETLAPPPVTDYAPLGRPIQSDQEWAEGRETLTDG